MSIWRCSRFYPLGEGMDSARVVLGVSSFRALNEAQLSEAPEPDTVGPG
jgi:hypothetical protein